jgi:RNA polymerase sigma-70 factor (ECF subfamily)
MGGSGDGRLERIRGAIDLYQGRLIAYAARITGDLESGRDVVQDTFLRLCREDLDGIADHLPAWLFTVCRNRALDVRKKEGPLRAIDSADDRPARGGEGDPHGALEAQDEARRVLDLVAELPPDQQEVLRLRFQQELSYKEISAVTRHSVGNVGFLIHVAIRRLRERLGVVDAAKAPQTMGEADA